MSHDTCQSSLSVAQNVRELRACCSYDSELLRRLVPRSNSQKKCASLIFEVNSILIKKPEDTTRERRVWVVMSSAGAPDGIGSITGQLIGQFAASIAPIYVTFFLGVGYCFTDVLKLDFVPAISVLIQYVGLPALLFLRLAETPTSQLNLPLLGADALSKLIPLIIMLVWWRFFSRLGRIKSMEWTVTYWMLSTLPNTVLIGDQILTPMFKNPVETWTTTIIFAQSLYWYNCVILMMEIREMIIEDEQGNIIAEPDIVPELTESELAEMERQQKIYALEDMEKSRPSWEMGSRPSSVWESNRPSMWEANRPSIDKSRPSWELGRASWSRAPYDIDMNDYSIGSMTPLTMTPRSVATPSRIMTPMMTPGRTPRGGFTPRRVNPGHLDRDHSIHNMDPSKLNRDDSIHSMTPGKFDRDHSFTSAISMSKGLEPEYDAEKVQTDVDPARPNFFHRMAVTLLRVVKRMLQVPLLYGSALGFIWSLNGIRLPSFMKDSLAYCAEITIALAMILLGQVCVKNIYGARGWIPCGWKQLFAGFAARFLFAPVVMWFCGMVISMKGTLLKYAILQVIVPQGSMTFALAQIYGCKLSVITPAIYVQMIVFVPIILAYSAFLSKV